MFDYFFHLKYTFIVVIVSLILTNIIYKLFLLFKLILSLYTYKIMILNMQQQFNLSFHLFHILY